MKLYPLVLVGLAAVQVPPPIPCQAVVHTKDEMFCYPVPAPTPTPTPPPACVPQRLNGLVVDKCAHPMELQEKPAYLASYVDKAFGTTIRRISAVPVTEGENAIVRPLYSTMQHWNDDESLMILYQRGRKWILLDGKTYAFKKYLELRSPTDIEQVNWIGNDFLIYPSNYNAIPDLMIHQVSTGTNTVLKNFAGAPTNCPTGDWGILLRQGQDPMRMSWAPSYAIGLNCGATKFVWDLVTKTVRGVVSVATSPHAPSATPSGQRFFLDGRSYNADLSSSFSLGLASVIEHSSVGLDENSREVYGSVVFDGGAGEGNLVLRSMEAAGQPRVIVGPASGWPTPRPGTHISAVAHKSPGTITVSIIGVPSRNGVLDQELLIWKGGQVYRIGHHRSLAGEGPWGYFAEPHASPSPTGTRVLYCSDWGGGASVDAYVVELPDWAN